MLNNYTEESESVKTTSSGQIKGIALSTTLDTPLVKIVQSIR